MERISCLLSPVVHLRKHSNTAKKRIFHTKKKYEKFIKPARVAAEQAPPQPLKYQPTYVPERWLPNGWSPPPPPEMTGLPKDNLPFQVERTTKGKWLPVYTDIRKGRTQLITILKKYTGDVDELQQEMSKVCHNKEVLIKTARLEVKGRYTKELRHWLAGLGF